MFELPIVIDATIKTECWTYYKTCILETSMAGRNWLATHMNVYLDDGFNVLFGDGRNIYPLHYFESSILTVESVNILRVKPHRIVEYIKNLLQKHYYIIIDCNIAKISLASDHDFFIHELMIYGFDDEKRVFFSPLLNNLTGKPGVTEISYDRFEASYKDIRDNYIQNPDTRFWRTYGYFYPITKIALKNNNSCNDNLIFRCLNKLEMEFDVEERKYIRYNDKSEVAFIWNHFNGLGCLLGLENIIKKTLKGEYDLKKSNTALTTSLLRLYEHRVNIIRTLELLDSLSNNCISTTTNIIVAYRELSVQIQKCYLMSKKWYISANVKLLSSIIEILRANRVEEEKVLRQTFNTVHQHLNSIYTVRRLSREKK